jgi:O-antigen/teichoic acid export membrane protein
MLRKSGFDFFREPVRISTSRFRELMSIAMPSLLSTAVVMPVLWIGNTELIVEEGFNAMGLLAIALFFFNVLQIVPQSIVIPLIPHISSLQKTRPGAGGSTSTELVKLTSIFIVPTILVASVYKDWIITFLFGEAYGPAGEATALLLIAGYFASMASVVGAMMAGIGRMWLSLSANVVWAASFLLLVFLLVPPYGLTGIGLAFAASYGIHLTAYFALARLACQISFGSSYMLTVVGTLIVTCGLVVTSDGLNAGIPAMTIYVLLGTMTIVALGWRTLDDTILRRFIRRR